MHPDMAEFYRKQDAERAKAADALAYGMANARIGQGNTVRCEGPTPYEVDNMRPYALLAVIAQEPPPALAKPASSPAPVRPIGNQGISDYQREIARNMAEGFAAWNAARQEALPSDEPASSPAGGDVATGLRAEIAHDGFTGDIIGRYVTREGKRGAVVQQDGTRVVHVYGEKWLPIETQMALSQSTSAGRVGE